MAPLGISSLSAPSSSSAAASVVTSNIISVAHTNGAESNTFNSGGGESNYASSGVGCCGGGLPGGIILTGTYQTVAPLPGLITGLIVHTNILAADITNSGNEDIDVHLRTAYLYAPSSSTIGQRLGVEITSVGTALTTGPSYSGDIGDIGTLRTFAPQTNIIGTTQNRIIGADYLSGAHGTMASYGYWTYGFIIHADYPSKTYKFRFDLEYDS